MSDRYKARDEAYAKIKSLLDNPCLDTRNAFNEGWAARKQLDLELAISIRNASAEKVQSRD